MPTLSTPTTFRNAGMHALAFLRSRLNYQLWMVTHRVGQDWVVAIVSDEGYGVREGDVFHWIDSFCARMMMGEGPNIAPNANEVEAYACAPIASAFKVGSYIGFPMFSQDGRHFGTLCAADPNPQPVSVLSEQPVIEMVTQMLSYVLESERRAEETERRALSIELQAWTDGLTGLRTRSAWERSLDFEEERCKSSGKLATVIFIDLDNLKVLNDSFGHAIGDAAIRSAAKALNETFHQGELVSRIGGDEFAILLLDVDRADQTRYLKALHEALERNQVAASVGVASLTSGKTLRDLVHDADQVMYAQKALKRQQAA